MKETTILLDDPITVQELIEKLESIKNKDLPVTLSAPSGYTDYFWIEICANEVNLGTT